MTTYKIKRKKYIADLFVPTKPKGAVVILIPGLPKSSNSTNLIDTFLNKGCFVIYPNLSGMQDSGGFLSGNQAMRDIKEFVGWAHEEFVTEIYYGKKINLGRNNKVILAGMSFGALLSLFAHREKIDQLILMSPALVYRQDDVDVIVDYEFKTQMVALVNLLKKAHPYTYRIKSYTDISNFLFGKPNYLSISNIVKELNEIKVPTTIVHGKKDSSVPYQITQRLQTQVNNRNIEWLFPEVGHSISTYDKVTLRLISKFKK